MTSLIRHHLDVVIPVAGGDLDNGNGWYADAEVLQELHVEWRIITSKCAQEHAFDFSSCVVVNLEPGTGIKVGVTVLTSSFKDTLLNGIFEKNTRQLPDLGMTRLFLSLADLINDYHEVLYKRNQILFLHLLESLLSIFPLLVVASVNAS